MDTRCPKDQLASIILHFWLEGKFLSRSFEGAMVAGM